MMVDAFREEAPTRSGTERRTDPDWPSIVEWTGGPSSLLPVSSGSTPPTTLLSYTYIPSASSLSSRGDSNETAAWNRVAHNVESTSSLSEYGEFNVATSATTIDLSGDDPYQFLHTTYMHFVSLPDLELQDLHPEKAANSANVHGTFKDPASFHVTEQHKPIRKAVHPHYPSTKDTKLDEAELKRHCKALSQQNSAQNKCIKEWLHRNKSSPYPSHNQILELSTLSGLTVRKVRICLRNLRARSNLDLSERATPQSTVEEASNQAPPRDLWQDFNDNEQISFFPGHEFTSSEGELSQSAIDPHQSFIDPGDEDWYATLDPALNWRLPLQPHNEIPQEHLPVGLDCQTTRALKRKGRRRHAPRSFQLPDGQPKGLSPHTSSNSGSDIKRNFHCTACPKSFVDVYNWKRHEGSVHGYSNIAWTCMLDELMMEGMKCIFCSELVDDIDHFDRHDIVVCTVKSSAERTFPRKDLLKQHVKNSHLVSTNDYMKREFKVPEFWSTTVDPSDQNPDALWCGICRCMLDTIPARMEHVAHHFAKGENLEAWVPRQGI